MNEDKFRKHTVAAAAYELQRHQSTICDKRCMQSCRTI